jgi:hypothetical protein
MDALNGLARSGAPSAAGASSEQLVREVYADTSPLMWPIARLSLEAHLIKLEREGRAARHGDLWSAAGK